MLKIMRSLLIIAILLSLTVAAPILSADTVSKGVTLYNPAKLGGTNLKAGDYWLNFDGSKLTLKQGKKVVAEAKAEWSDAKATVQGDSVVVESGAITEIRIDGRKQVIKVL